MKPTKLLATCSAMMLVGAVSTSYAGGFQLFEAGVSALGNAFAGTAAVANDASIEFYNPAGMTHLKHPEFSIAATGIQLNTRVNIYNAVNTTKFTVPIIQPPPTFAVSAPVTGGSTSYPGGWNLVPAFHFVYPWHRVAFGFGIDAPFGLQTQYKDDSMARFLATRSRIIVINAGPSVAFQVTPKLSVGVGFDVQYLKANLDQDVAIVPGPINLPGPLPDLPAVDGTFTNSGDDFGYGWNAGVLYQFTPDTRVGFAYRSKVSHRLEGNANLDLGNTGIEQLASTFGNVSSNITLPDYMNLSLFHAFNQKFDVMAGVNFTHWSEIQNVTLNFSGPIAESVKTITVPLDFRNTWRFSLGADYHPTQKWTLRVGTAYDQSPVDSDTSRTFRLPDNNRYWLAAGVGYKFSPALSVDLGYSHLFVKDSHINRTQVNPAAFGPINAELISSAMADVKANVNEVGLQLNWDLLPDSPPSSSVANGA